MRICEVELGWWAVVLVADDLALGVMLVAGVLVGGFCRYRGELVAEVDAAEG